MSLPPLPSLSLFPALSRLSGFGGKEQHTTWMLNPEIRYVSLTNVTDLKQHINVERGPTQIDLPFPLVKLA